MNLHVKQEVYCLPPLVNSSTYYEEENKWDCSAVCLVKREVVVGHILDSCHAIQGSLENGLLFHVPSSHFTHKFLTGQLIAPINLSLCYFVLIVTIESRKKELCYVTRCFLSWKLLTKVVT